MGIFSSAGCVEALAGFSVPARLPPDKCFTLSGFLEISRFLASAAEQPSEGEAAPPVSGQLAANAPVRVRSVENCQLLTRALLQARNYTIFEGPLCMRKAIWLTHASYMAKTSACVRRCIE